MAKVTGPLMSMDAAGAFGGTLVFGKWKGRNTVRQLVTPSNPQTAGQTTARNRTRVTGAMQNWVNTTTMKAPTQTLTDKERIKAVTPGGQAWNGYLTASIIGAGGLSYDAAQTAFAALTSEQKAAWAAEAASFTPVINDVYQADPGGMAGTPITAAEVFFIYQYALSLIGLADTPGAVPPNYA